MTSIGEGSVAVLNQLSNADFHDVMKSCCASKAYVNGMADRRPFASEASLHAASRAVWFALPTDDWLQAFAAHPRIGGMGKKASHAGRFEKWSESEQAGISDAAENVMADLGVLNEKYYQKHGFVFLICATGKSAEEMTGQLRTRLDNDTEREVEIAAQEQAKITELRLRKAIREGVTSR